LENIVPRCHTHHQAVAVAGRVKDEDQSGLRNNLMKYLVWGLVLVLIILHQDIWNWDNDRLVMGVVPVTLAYHAGISIAASIAWFMMIQFAWPLPDGNSDITDPREDRS
jgi:hypothetical protein